MDEELYRYARSAEGKLLYGYTIEKLFLDHIANTIRGLYISYPSE